MPPKKWIARSPLCRGRLSADGREQVVALRVKGDWLGFDGIYSGQHGCDAVKSPIWPPSAPSCGAA